eukprot:TRINITY_DN1320_c1_g3_i1.p1 TRINITY_DN1320_c1_g3~~TRINITY_DN1320_c1_g3_i1.p1  ORF type:complete len:329 (+),score=107.69 TRINITY_DN1320_c1_g3_i1:53-1039(+)
MAAALLGLALLVPSSAELQDLVKRVNDAQLTWRASVPTRFASTKEAQALCGTYLKGHELYKEPENLATVEYDVSDLPAAFDARDAFPNCSVIGHVRDQSDCGSCWAFGATEAYEGRRCAQKGEDIAFSEEDVLSCCNPLNLCFAMGCNGGNPGMALGWMSLGGVVTGGDYGAEGTCRPYTLAPCSHHSNSSKLPPCPAAEYKTPACKKECGAGFPQTYAQQKSTYRGGLVHLVEGRNNLKAALMKGPVAVAMEVYEDFVAYTGGVYTHHTGKWLGGHAVLLVGWGVDNGTEYWRVKNSWNDSWGEAGFFRIAFGQCGIDSLMPFAVDF